jgi:RHS repeat-associated protein
VSYAYDYFVQDHLGNVRMVLTEQTDFSMYAATMEKPVAAKETALFSNVDNTRADKPVGYPADESAGTNAAVAKLTATASGKKIGPSIVLKVMAGDTVQLSAKAFYKSGGPKGKNSAAPLSENILADLIQAFNGSEAGDNGRHGLARAKETTPFSSNFYNNDYQRLKAKEADQPDADRPKAYLNFVLFDEQLKLVEENSGVKRVKAEPDQLQTLGQDKMVVNKTGFLYVYTSNESIQDVYFDNIILGINSGPLLEETHYYPFGLTMAGISSNALKGKGYSENKYKFNHGSELQNSEFSDGSGLEFYETPLRSLDPQIGRWLQIDSKPHDMMSPYTAMANNPILYSDPAGDTTWLYGTAGQYLGTINDKLANQVHFMDNDNLDAKPLDASKLSAKESRKLAQAMRGASVAFMGDKTFADMKSISNQSEALGKEIGFVGKIGSDKEIRLTAMSVDNTNTADGVDLISQVEKNYSKQQQADLFLAGHVHQTGALYGFSYGDGSPMTMQRYLGKPSPVDYQPVLYRSGDASARGQSPALVPTKYGVTIYGTATGKTNSGLFLENEVRPSTNSYLLYKSFKK